jgi:hypothetical protein
MNALPAVCGMLPSVDGALELQELKS